MNGPDLRPHVYATVVNIQDFDCPIGDKMLVDTNVLYFCYYDRFSHLETLGEEPSKYQTTTYPTFLKKLLDLRTALFVHKIGLLEFANTVERAELRILYCRLNDVTEVGGDFSPKFLRRSYPGEYRVIQGQLATYLHQIRKKYRLLNNNISINDLLTNFFIEWQDSLGEPGDAMMIEGAKRNGVTSILSDDADLATFKDITLYTANRTAIEAYNEKNSQTNKH